MCRGDHSFQMRSNNFIITHYASLLNLLFEISPEIPESSQMKLTWNGKLKMEQNPIDDEKPGTQYDDVQTREF